MALPFGRVMRTEGMVMVGSTPAMPAGGRAGRVVGDEHGDGAGVLRVLHLDGEAAGAAVDQGDLAGHGGGVGERRAAVGGGPSGAAGGVAGSARRWPTTTLPVTPGAERSGTEGGGADPVGAQARPGN